MEKEYYLTDHDQNVKGGVLWWLLLLVFLVSVTLFASDVEEKNNLHHDKSKSKITKSILT